MPPAAACIYMRCLRNLFWNGVSMCEHNLGYWGRTRSNTLFSVKLQFSISSQEETEEGSDFCFPKSIPETLFSSPVHDVNPLHSVQERQRAEKLVNTTCERDEFVRSEACRFCNKGLVVQNISLFSRMLQWNLMNLRSPVSILLCLCCGVCAATAGLFTYPWTFEQQHAAIHPPGPTVPWRGFRGPVAFSWSWWIMVGHHFSD